MNKFAAIIKKLFPNYESKKDLRERIAFYQILIESLNRQKTKPEVINIVSQMTITKETLIYTPLSISLEDYITNYLASGLANQIKHHMNVKTTTNPLSGDREYMARIWVVKGGLNE